MTQIATDIVKFLNRYGRIIKETDSRIFAILNKESRGDPDLLTQLLQQTAFAFLAEAGYQLDKRYPRYSPSRELADAIMHPAAIRAFDAGNRKIKSTAKTEKDLALLYCRVIQELLQHLFLQLKTELLKRCTT